MKPSFSSDWGAVVGRAEDRAWCDTMPGGMALRVHSVDVGGAFTVVEADVPAFTGHRWTITKSARKPSKYLIADFASSVPAMSSNLGGTAQRADCAIDSSTSTGTMRSPLFSRWDGSRARFRRHRSTRRPARREPVATPAFQKARVGSAADIVAELA
jgi:hypothetical protein